MATADEKSIPSASQSPKLEAQVAALTIELASLKTEIISLRDVLKQTLGVKPTEAPITEARPAPAPSLFAGTAKK